MQRADLERIYAARHATRFAGAVRIGFAAPGDPTTLTLPAPADVVLRSDREARAIRAVLDARARARRAKAREAADQGSGWTAKQHEAAEGLQRRLDRSRSALGGVVPYTRRETETLEADLQRLKATYALDDEYELVELYSHKVNVALFNDGAEHVGAEHVEAARVELEIPATPGLVVAEEPLNPPFYGLHGGPQRMPFLRGLLQRGYPRVTRRTDGSTHVADELGDVRHQTRTLAFAEPLRLLVAPSTVGATVPLVATLHGKNLRQPVTATLTLVVGPPDGSMPTADPDA